MLRGIVRDSYTAHPNAQCACIPERLPIHSIPDSRIGTRRTRNIVTDISSHSEIRRREYSSTDDRRIRPSACLFTKRGERAVATDTPRIATIRSGGAMLLPRQFGVSAASAWRTMKRGKDRQKRSDIREQPIHLNRSEPCISPTPGMGARDFAGSHP